jgi:hypothetical protein
MMSWNAENYLKGLYTKQLMTVRDTIRRLGDQPYEVNNEPNYGDRWVTIEQVLAELATREHVPNKIESKLIRQEKAKSKRSR